MLSLCLKIVASHRPHRSAIMLTILRTQAWSWTILGFKMKIILTLYLNLRRHFQTTRRLKNKWDKPLRKSSIWRSILSLRSKSSRGSSPNSRCSMKSYHPTAVPTTCRSTNTLRQSKNFRSSWAWSRPMSTRHSNSRTGGYKTSHSSSVTTTLTTLRKTKQQQSPQTTLLALWKTSKCSLRQTLSTKGWTTITKLYTLVPPKSTTSTKKTKLISRWF